MMPANGSAALLRRDDEMGASVFRERRLVVPGIERELLAIADRAEAFGGDAGRQQVSPCGERPTFPQCQIVLGCPSLVAVTFDRHGPGRILLENGRVLLEHRFRRWTDLVTVELEDHGFQR